MSSQDYTEQLKLSDAKQMRKRAEEDARLLSNRIALLKLEELKAVKKIEETQKKAQEIIRARNRTLEEQKKKEELKNKRISEENLKIQKNRQLRENEKKIKMQASNYKINKAHHDSMSMKMTLEHNARIIEHMRLEELAHKTFMKESVKQQHKEAEEKRKKLLESKKEKARKENERRIDEENMKRKIREDEVARMEQEELELIQRLQNTQLLQKTAYEDLEHALSGNAESYTNF